MINPPAVIVHGLAQARVALVPGLPVTLLSGRGAALYAGCAWWHALVAEVRHLYPQVAITDILDCADAPGRAMAALRIGQRRLILEPGPAWDEVAGAAASLGAELLSERPDALDLSAHGAPRRLQAWLGRGGDTASTLG